MNAQLGSSTMIYGNGTWLSGEVADIKSNSDESVRLLGIRPDGFDHVTYFAPVPDNPQDVLQSVGSQHTYAFLI